MLDYFSSHITAQFQLWCMHGPPVSSARPEGPKMHNPKLHNAKQSKDAQRTASGRRATPRIACTCMARKVEWASKQSHLQVTKQKHLNKTNPKRQIRKTKKNPNKHIRANKSEETNLKKRIWRNQYEQTNLKKKYEGNKIQEKTNLKKQIRTNGYLRNTNLTSHSGRIINMAMRACDVFARSCSRASPLCALAESAAHALNAQRSACSHSATRKPDNAKQRYL